MFFAKQNSFALDLAFSAPPDTPKHRDRALDAPWDALFTCAKAVVKRCPHHGAWASRAHRVM